MENHDLSLYEEKSPAKLLPKELVPMTPEQDKDPVPRYLERKKRKPPVVNSTRYEDPVTTLAKYSDALGSVSDDFRSLIFEQVGACSAHLDRSMVLNSCLAMLNAFKP